MPDYAAVERLIGYRFSDRNLLTVALSHRSAVRSNEESEESNERLEFLGDSVLGVVIAHQLYLDHPNKAEGALTKAKSALVNETTLAEIGKLVGLNSHILLSPEEQRAGGNERASIVADAVEAVIGAVYLDGGYDAAQRLILTMIYAHRDEITTAVAPKNYKGELLEHAQAHGGVPPKYEVRAEEGPDHDKLFEVVVILDNQELGSGTGSSKKEAEQQAAQDALRRLSRLGSSA